MAAIPKEVMDAAIADFLAGMSRRDVAAKHFLAEGTLGRNLKKRGIKLSPEESKRRRVLGGKKKKPSTRKCEPDCTCNRHSRPNGVVMGHRICNSKVHQGPRWVPLTSFDAHKRDDDGNAIEWQYVCKACNRIIQRHRTGMKRRGRPYQQRVAAMSPEQRAAHRRQIHAEKMQDPAYVESRREYARIWAEVQRRKQGIEPRQMKARVTPGRYQRLDAEPMALWVQKNLPRYESNSTIMGKACGVDEGTIRRLYYNKVDFIGEDLVDRMLLKEGSTDLWEVYPHLFAFEESDQAAA